MGWRRLPVSIAAEMFITINRALRDSIAMKFLLLFLCVLVTFFPMRLRVYQKKTKRNRQKNPHHFQLPLRVFKALMMFLIADNPNENDFRFSLLFLLANFRSAINFCPNEISSFVLLHSRKCCGE